MKKIIKWLLAFILALFCYFAGVFTILNAHNEFMETHVCYESPAFERVTAHQIYCKLHLNNSWEKSWDWWNSLIPTEGGFIQIENDQKNS